MMPGATGSDRLRFQLPASVQCHQASTLAVSRALPRSACQQYKSR